MAQIQAIVSCPQLGLHNPGDVGEVDDDNPALEGLLGMGYAARVDAKTAKKAAAAPAEPSTP